MQAQRKLAIAEHLLTKSYPSLNDPKILLSVLQNTLEAIEEALTQRLQEARKNKEIPTYNTSFNGKLTAYKLHLANNSNLSRVDFMMISEMQELLEEHKQAPTAFRRNNNFVIADNNFNLKTLDEKKTRTYLKRTKKLINKL